MIKDFSLLKERHIEDLEYWIKFDPWDRKFECPIGKCAICRDLFPRCNTAEPKCPCCVYTMGYLTTVAKKAIKYLKEKYHA